MIPINDSRQAAEAKYAIEQAMLDDAPWTLLLGETSIAVNRRNCEWSVEWGKLIFAWWNEEHSQSWRVTAYAIEDAELIFQATRGMARELATLTLRQQERWRERLETEELDLTERRRSYAQLLARLLTGLLTRLPGAPLPKAATDAEPAPSAPGKYARAKIKQGKEIVLAIGVCAAESQAGVDGVIAAGLVWLADFNQRREAGGQSNRKANRLRFCLPAGRAQTAIERLTSLDASRLGARLECFEVDERHETLTAVHLATQDELLNAHPRELKWPASAPPENPWRERIVRFAPELIEVRQIAERESYAIHGLEFARWSGGETPRTTFGVAGLQGENQTAEPTRLSEASFPRLESLVREIAARRNAGARDRRHPFYRLREEAWLESLLRRNIRALDAAFDEGFVYSQIPAWRGEERSVIDLLTVKWETGQEPRLAVIEIKASEDAQLPLQGLDYWLRVEQARLRGEFARRGLFPALRLADRPPLLYLVAPRLRFHRTFATVARCLSPRIEAYQVGVNLNWRAGVRVHSIERINAPTEDSSQTATEQSTAVSRNSP